MPNLRRLSPITWVAVVTVLVALIPDQLPLGLARSLARYLLIAYLPGLAIWSRLKSSSSSLVDLILYPSLLSILPFAWIGLAAVALGFSLRLAACLAIAFFLVVGFWFGWSAQTRATRGDNIAISVAAMLALVLLVVPFAANSFQAVAWDAPLHAAIVSRILGGAIPPDSPMMAGQPANYYWLYHFYSALLMRLTGWSVYQVFAVLNVHALILFTLAGYRIAARLTTDLFGQLSAAWMLVFGLNAFGWVIFLSHGSQNPDRWYSLVSPFAMVLGYSPSLGSLLHEFLDGFPFVISFAFDIAWLELLLRRVDGERGRVLVIAVLILATQFYLHPLSAVFLVGASLVALMTLALIDRGRTIAERSLVVLDVIAVVFSSAAVTIPYAWDILRAKTGAPLSLELNFAFLENRAWSIVAGTGLLLIIAAPGIWRAIRQRERAILVLTLFAGALAVAALVTHVALEAEYKLIYLLAFALSALVAVAWTFWQRTFLNRLVFVLALAVSVPTNLLTAYSFTIHPPRESREPSRQRLLQWVREQTPANAIIVEYPWWEEYQTSDAAYLYLDRYWFDVGVYANRRQLIGYGAPMLEQWGYRDIALRQALAHKLIEGGSLSAADVSYLSSFRASIIVVTSSAAVRRDAFDPGIYLPVYQDGDIRAYRVVFSQS